MLIFRRLLGDIRAQFKGRLLFLLFERFRFCPSASGRVRRSTKSAARKAGNAWQGQRRKHQVEQWEASHKSVDSG